MESSSLRLKVQLISVCFLFSVGGCATYTITPDDLATQLRDNQERSPWFVNTYMVGLTLLLLADLDIERNGMETIKCFTSDGKQVFLTIDPNTQAEITLKSTQEVEKMYFDTELLVEVKLVSHRTRLASKFVKRTEIDLDLDTIEPIEIFTEFPKTEPVKVK